MSRIKVMCTESYMKRKAIQYAKEDYDFYESITIQEVNYEKQFVIVLVIQSTGNQNETEEIEQIYEF